MMLINYNNKFIDFLGKSFIEEAVLVEPKFNSFLYNSEFVNFQGGYFFDFLKPEGKLSPNLIDITGNEAFYNKIQVVDYIKSDLDTRSILIQSVKFSLVLASKLNKFVNDVKFSVLLTFDGEYESVTFFAVRENENYINEDLEKMFFPVLLVRI